MTRIGLLLAKKEVETLAITHLGFKAYEISHINEDCKGDSEKEIREILLRWRNKSTKNTVVVCQHKLNYSLELKLNKIF